MSVLDLLWVKLFLKFTLISAVGICLCSSWP